MSLKAWYPLDGSLKDYSGNLQNMSGDWVLDTGGKIGKCYRKKSSYGMTIPLSPKDIGDTMTFSFWIYVPATSSGSIIFSDKPYNSYVPTRTIFTCYQFPTKNDFHLSTSIAGAGPGNFIQFIDKGVLLDDAWTHVCVTYENLNLKIYYNGKLGRNETLKAKPNVDVIDNIIMVCGDNVKMNDVRFYDEVLSAKEIKEIAKAKILHYDFNQKNDTRVSDTSGFRNHSLKMNASVQPQWIDSSILGSGCYKFNKNNYIAIGNKCKPTDAITISTWAYKDNWSSTHIQERIISCTEGGGWHIGINRVANRLSCQLYTQIGHLTRMPSVKLKDMTSGWHHIVCTFDGRYVKLYLDTVLKDTFDIGKTASMKYHPTNGIFIGAEAAGDEVTTEGAYFNGYIDDTRIYATVLTDEDILELYRTRASVTKTGKIVVNEIHEDVTEIKIINSVKATVGTESHKIIYTGLPTGATNISTLVEGDNTLGETHLQGYLYVSSLSYLPDKFEYTKENSTKGFIMSLTPPKNGWKVGWNYFSQKVTGYVDADNTNWSNMNRLRIYHNGTVPSAVTTEYLHYKDVYLVKKKDNSTINRSNISKKGQLNTSSINEVSRKIRYVRDYLNGSNLNGGKHWLELQVISNNVNIAKGIIPTSSGKEADNLKLEYATDEKMYTYCEIVGVGPQYIQLDLGDLVDVDCIKVWHYYHDNRIYHQAKTQVSVDGTTWITLFDSDIDGEYAETVEGRTYYLYRSMPHYKMFKDGSIETTEIIED